MTQYIDKSTLVAEIERKILAIDNTPKITDTQIAVLSGNKVTLTKLLSFIDTLETKEVDLDAAIERFVEQHKSELNGYFDIRRIARHFYVLGLNAQKGE